jgi:branched-chain amino acid transport system substrate-binding protein
MRWLAAARATMTTAGVKPADASTPMKNVSISAGGIFRAHASWAKGRRIFRGLLLANAIGNGYAPGLSRHRRMPAVNVRHDVWEDSMVTSQRSWPVDRRAILKTSVALAAVQFYSPFIIKARGETPVRIGMVDPLTGVYAAIAQGEVVGARFAVEEINKKGGILGRPVELLIEDSANDVGTGVQKTRKLIERDQVSFIVGDVNSGIAIAMAQVTSEKKVLHIVSGGHTDPITGANCSWNVFRVCNSTTMDANAIASTLIEKFGKKWYFLTPDYAYGHSVQAGFEKA